MAAILDLEGWCARATRLALAAAFLSAVASRFGLWQGQVAMARFREFIVYTGEVNAFLPKAWHPLLAWLATVAETSLGVALLLGFRPRMTALLSAGLLSLFGLAMAISQGIQSPLDYSVFSAAGGALLLWRHRVRKEMNPANDQLRGDNA